MSASGDDERDEVRHAFEDAVNMAPAEIEAWLDTEDSKEVGSKEGGRTESVGHASGRRIVDILRKDADELTSSDVEHMRKVVGYVHRHLAQRPEGDVEDSPWRHSLMNWGHDPLK